MIDEQILSYSSVPFQVPGPRVLPAVRAPLPAVADRARVHRTRGLRQELLRARALHALAHVPRRRPPVPQGGNSTGFLDPEFGPKNPIFHFEKALETNI